MMVMMRLAIALLMWHLTAPPLFATEDESSRAVALTSAVLQIAILVAAVVVGLWTVRSRRPDDHAERRQMRPQR